MATKTVYLPYWVYIADKDEAVRLGASIDPGQNQAVGTIIRAPDDAATEFNAPKYNSAQVWPVGENCTVSDYFAAGNPNWENLYPTNVASFTRKSGGWFGISWLFGTTTNYYWRGAFRWNPKIDASSVPGETKVAMSPPIWIDGFELPDEGEGGTGSLAELTTGPHASRHPGGWGMAVRNSANYKSHRTDEPDFDADYTGQDGHWDKFYFRLKKAPDISTRIYRVYTAPSANLGIELQVTPSGTVSVYAYDAGNTANLLGTLSGEAFTLHTWYRIDVLTQFQKAPITGWVKVFINGVQRFTMEAASMASGWGVNSIANVQYVRLGAGSTGHHGAWDYDDWRGAKLPNATYAGLDFLHGSKMVRVPLSGFAASNDGNFAPAAGHAATNWRLLTARAYPSSTAVAYHGLSTTAASARLSVVADTVPLFAEKGSMGMAAMVVGARASRTGAVSDSQVGYKLPGGSDVLRTVYADSTSPIWNTIFYTPIDTTIDPVTLAEGLELIYIGNSAAPTASKVCYELTAVIELIGDFFPEDRVPQTGDPEDLSTLLGQTEHFPAWLHNAPYPESPYTKAGPPPLGVVAVKGGTYTGNGQTVQLAFPAPVCMLFVRRASNNDGFHWLSSSPGSAIFTASGLSPIVEALIDRSYTPATEDDSATQTLIRICGNRTNFNEAGTTYQYLAVMDPAMRFFSVGQLHGLAYGDWETPNCGGWTPEAAILHQGSTNESTVSFHLLPFQHTAGVVFSRAVAALTGAASVGDGKITTPAGSPLYQSQGQYSGIAYAAIRRNDGSGDEGASRCVALVTWTGDGVASRTISIAPPSGRRPMYAIAWGSGGSCIYRDPTHTGTTSTAAPAAANASTGFTAGGIDQFTVGSALNGNGVTYSAIVFWSADATAGNNGWGTNGTNYPVDPGTNPTGGTSPWGDEPPLPGEPTGPVEPEPTPGTDEVYDFSDDCIDDSIKIINRALSRIGISKQIGDILTETSAEATAARLHYTDDVSATLRDFPWPFATRYAKLYACYGAAEEQELVQPWYSTRAYEVGECVLLSDVVYYCTVANTNHNPSLAGSAAYWTEEAPEEANGDWLYGYRVPDRFVFARRIVDPLKTRRAWDPDPPPFRLGSDEHGLIIYSNQLNAELEYTVRLQCAAAVGDPLFRSALAWRHAHSIAPALARDEKKVAYCWSMYDALLNQAKRWAASEQQHEKEGDADWITARQ